MKKILFLLVLIYNFSFAEWVLSSSPFSGGLPSNAWVVSNGAPTTGDGNWYFTGGGSSTSKNANYQTYTSPNGSNILIYFKKSGGLADPCTSEFNLGDSVIGCNFSNGLGELLPPNPDPLGEPRCRDLFQKDGQAYTCNPNSNEATPIPNSNGTILDPESPNGNDKPNCNSGYEAVGTMTVAGGGNSSYNNWSCVAIPTTPPTDTGGTGSGTTSPSISYGGDGSTTMTLPDGTKQTTYGDGWVTTTYPDGTTSSTAPHSSGGSGTSGGGGGSSGSGTTGNTTNETTPTPTEDTPIDNTPVANSCSDSALTLQEKMLCELNAGMKKQNSEGNPSNSLNQLLKDLKTSNQTDNTAINTNLKDIESGTTQLVNKQTQANTTLDKINNSANATELYTKSMNDGINKISKQLEADPTIPDTGNALDGSGSIIDTLANEYTTFKNNMINQGNTIGSLIDSSKQTINQGFSFSLAQSDVTSCPMNSQLDLTSINQGILNITLDICEYSSMLKPYLYPLFLIFMTLGLVFASFRLIGVLL